MNFADLTTVITVLSSAGVAGVLAAREKAGWFTVLFVAAGLAFSFGCIGTVCKLADRLLEVCDRQSKALFGWATLLAYILVLGVAAFGVTALTGWLTILITRHIR
jgi:hypothetical protein